MYSVIIPSLGRINYLNELLDSLYKQTITPKEIIILLDNNNSCKDSEKLINIKNNCRIIFCEKLNLPQKRNYGALIANTKYLIFSDDDDIWELRKAELTVASLKKNKVVAHAFSKFGYSYLKPRFTMGKKNKIISLKNLIFGSNIFGGGSAIAAWKEIVIAIPFNEKYYFCEDYDWWIKVLLADIEINYIPISLVKYRVHNQNMTSNNFKIYLFNIKIFNKIIIKSTILFVTFFSGYIRSTISLILKLTKNILISSIIKNSRK